MSTNENLLEQYLRAHKELDEAEENVQLVEQRHSGGSGSDSFGVPIQFLDVGHPEVQQAWERHRKAWENVVELRRQLREKLP